MKKPIAAIFILLVLQSCSMMKLGYNNADWLLTWQIDEYFDLSSEQEDFVEERFEEHLLWHRHIQLPQYSELIEEMIFKVESGISGEDYEWSIKQFKKAYQRTIIRILPDATRFLMSLEPEQIDFYEEKVTERYRKSRYGTKRTEEEHRQRRSVRTINRLEEWFGDFTER